MKRKNELNAAEAEHVVSLMIRAGIPRIMAKPLTPESSTELFEKLRWVRAQSTPHERRVLGAKDFSDESLRKAVRNAKRKLMQSQERTGRERKKHRLAK